MRDRSTPDSTSPITAAALPPPPAYTAAMRPASVAAASCSCRATSYRRPTSDKALLGVVSAAHSTSSRPSSSSSKVCALAKA